MCANETSLPSYKVSNIIRAANLSIGDAISLGTTTVCIYRNSKINDRIQLYFIPRCSDRSTARYHSWQLTFLFLHEHDNLHRRTTHTIMGDSVLTLPFKLSYIEKAIKSERQDTDYIRKDDYSLFGIFLIQSTV